MTFRCKTIRPMHGIGRNMACIGCGLAVTDHVRGVIRDDAIPGLTIDIELGYDRQLHRFTPFSVSVTREGDDEIALATLQKLRIETYCVNLLEKTVRVLGINPHCALGWNDIRIWVDTVPEANHSSISKAVGIPAEALLQIGKIYRLAETMNIPPAKFVEQCFGISHATASRWIAKAKKNVPDWYGDEMQSRLSKLSFADLFHLSELPPASSGQSSR